MNLIPLIKLDKYKLSSEKNRVIEMLKGKTNILYILDLQGINKNKPDLDIYQKLSNNFELWVDSGPRDIGDVVDAFFAGANLIVIRLDIWREEDISIVRDFSDNRVFINIDSNNIYKSIVEMADGLISFIGKDEIKSDFKFNERFKELAMKKDVYCYEEDIKRKEYWKKLGAKGILVNVENTEGFERYGF